jgi:hypothetical protein
LLLLSSSPGFLHAFALLLPRVESCAWTAALLSKAIIIKAANKQRSSNLDAFILVWLDIVIVIVIIIVIYNFGQYLVLWGDGLNLNFSSAKSRPKTLLVETQSRFVRKTVRSRPRLMFLFHWPYCRQVRASSQPMWLFYLNTLRST